MNHQARIRILEEAYAAFNDREVERVLAVIHPEVDWPNAWEGGRMTGRNAVRDYWRRQFAEISGQLEPLAFDEEPDGSISVRLRQVVSDPKSGELIADAETTQRWWFDADDLVVRMDVLGEPD